MAILKKVRKPQDLVPGERYLDTHDRRVLVFDSVYPIHSMYAFHDLYDEDNVYMRFSEIQGRLRCFNITDMELRALLCTSMIEFLELMIFEKDKNKGGKV